jgi:hypothetical protein
VPAQEKIGVILPVSPAYFRKAHETLLEIGVKLAQVFWRKLIPAQLKEADGSLVTLSYQLLEEGRYDLAKALLDFATEVLKKHSSTDYRLRFVVNRAQAYKWSGDEVKARTILDREDFSALSDAFKLANAVLRNNFESAVDLVEKIGRSGPVKIGDYRAWPLFRELRKRPEFEASILRVFGEPLNATIEVPQVDGSPQEQVDVEEGKR